MRTALAAALLAAALPAAAQDPDERRPPLFVVEDADSRVTLLGSIHVLPESQLPLPPALDAAFEASEIVAFEIDLDAAERDAAAMALKGMNGTTVLDALDAEQLKRLDAVTSELGAPSALFHRFEPWLAALTVGAFDLQKRDAMARGGVDRHLFDRAKRLDREIIPLETVAHQTDVFDGLPVKDQVAFLMATLDATEDDEDGYAHLLDTWARGDDAGLAAIMNEGFEASPRLHARLLADRNRAWVPQIEALLARDQDAVVIVGAGHLVGEDSVVTMLREAGYEVVRQ